MVVINQFLQLIYYYHSQSTFRFQNQHDDFVSGLPFVDKVVKNKMQSGYINVDKESDNNIFYWFTESDLGNNNEIPLIMWQNGGPGASSAVGILFENLGIYNIQEGGTLSQNPNTWTKFAHVIIFDNPVGSGFSQTGKRKYVKNENEMASQLTSALLGFFQKHKEYENNPLWLVGESYAGVYIPNLAQYIDKNKNKTIKLTGMIIGNGYYDAITQYNTIAKYAYAQGLIDEIGYKNVKIMEENCITLIKNEEQATAGVYCETIENYLYNEIIGLFKYDVQFHKNLIDGLSELIRAWIERPEVKKALHVKPDQKWQVNDNIGPVAEALKNDTTKTVIPKLEYLLNKGYKMLMYNGQRDGTVCNHLGNLDVALKLKYDGNNDFLKQPQKRVLDKNNKIIGFIKGTSMFKYMLVINTGHLVTKILPETASQIVDQFIKNNLGD